MQKCRHADTHAHAHALFFSHSFIYTHMHTHTLLSTCFLLTLFFLVMEKERGKIEACCYFGEVCCVLCVGGGSGGPMAQEIAVGGWMFETVALVIAQLSHVVRVRAANSVLHIQMVFRLCFLVFSRAHSHSTSCFLAYSYFLPYA